MQKKNFFNANLQKKSHYFYNSKIRCVKNRFQIFILHPKKQTIKEKKNDIFYVAS